MDEAIKQIGERLKHGSMNLPRSRKVPIFAFLQLSALVIVVPWQSKHKPLRQLGHYGVGLCPSPSRPSPPLYIWQPQ